MSENIIIALIGIGGVLITQIGILIVGLRNGKKTDANARQLSEIHINIDGKMAQLIALTEKSSFAEGVKSETDKTSSK